MTFAVRGPLSSGNGNGKYGNKTAPNSNSWAGNTVADEATVDAFAMKVLQEASPSDVSVDADSLGPYITGVLRAEQAETDSNDLEDLPDYENVLELLQEHCSMSQEDAKKALGKIAQAVRTGAVPLEYYVSATGSIRSLPLGPFGSPPSHSSNSGGLNALQLLDNVNVAATAAEKGPLHSNYPGDINTAVADSSVAASESRAATSVISPVQPNNLIPIDLLGAIDDEGDERGEEVKSLSPFAPVNISNSRSNSLALEEEFPSLEVSAASKTKKKASRSSRSRQGSMDDSLTSEHSSKKVSPHLQPAVAAGSFPYYYSLDTNNNNDDPATLLQMACDMLTSMNPDIGQDAVFQAATMAQSNVGLAQYLVDCAVTAPPVCRHLLHAGCYRADCQFNHDLEGHTCVFWLRGRCGKGSSCPFLHGYNQKWLEQLEAQQQQQLTQEQVHYNAQQEHYYHRQWEQEHQEQSQISTSASTFANIAQQGYNNQTAFQQSRSSSTGSLPSSSGDYDEGFANLSTIPTMRIPQDVWDPHERRDASAFHIADPLERYREVSRAHRSQVVSTRNPDTGRTDLIDLHFQSTRTFAAVLANVLPEKLASEPNGVWIVTGTGHHVATKTHQKGGGILESAVMTWLLEHGYEFFKGKDRNGHGGAVFVKYANDSGGIGQ